MICSNIWELPRVAVNDRDSKEKENPKRKILPSERQGYHYDD